MAIPPGPQIPFSKDRTYGQEPGFVSRHSGKLFFTIAVVVLIGVAWVFFEAIKETRERDDRELERNALDIEVTGADGETLLSVKYR